MVKHIMMGLRKLVAWGGGTVLLFERGGELFLGGVGGGGRLLFGGGGLEGGGGVWGGGSCVWGGGLCFIWGGGVGGLLPTRRGGREEGDWLSPTLIRQCSSVDAEA